jgi:hypothetical protein
MATGHSTSKRLSSRNRRRLGGTRSGIPKDAPAGATRTDPRSNEPSGEGRPIRIAIPLRAFLKVERDAVIQVQSLLVCVAQAMEADHGDDGPYYPDVVGLAADILRQRVVNLDDLLLDGLAPAD